jgi:Flp pilus assembly protein TadD
MRLMSRALELERLDATVLWMGAMTAWQLEQDTVRAMELVSRSLDINPNSPIAWTVLGWTEVFTGNYTKGKELLTRAQRLSPRDPRGWFAANGMAMASLGEGRFEEALSWARRARAQNPSHIGSMRLTAASLAQLGRREEAAGVVADMLRVQPSLTISETRAPRRTMHDALWEKFSAGLRLAGVPE